MFTPRLRSCGNLLILLPFCFLLLLAGCAAKDSEVDPQAAVGSLSLKGRVRHISLEEKRITLKPRKGNRIIFLYDEKTVFTGASSAETINIDQPVQIIYKLEGDDRIALSVTLLSSCQ